MNGPEFPGKKNSEGQEQNERKKKGKKGSGGGNRKLERTPRLRVVVSVKFKFGLF